MSYQTLIDAVTLRQWMERAPGVGAELAIIDCRFDLGVPKAGRELYLAGHIPGAVYADLNEDLSAPVTPESGRHPLPRPEAFAATLERFAVGRGIQVVAYDAAGGAFAARLWWMLREWGHAEVAVLDGGYPAWIAAGGASVAGGEQRMPGASTSRTERQPAIEKWPVETAATVAELRKDPHRLLIDARAAERYAGTVEPIDTAAGHVPGAVNHPFSANLGADGRFLSPPQLHSRWRERLGDRSASEVVMMCGSGVTACHNLLGLEVAGLPGAKLYAGSWSEWIRNPHRPIEKGS